MVAIIIKKFKKPNAWLEFKYQSNFNISFQLCFSYIALDTIK